MALSKTQREAIISEFAMHEGDVGSPEVQVALLTARIKAAAEHVKIHRGDLHTRRGLVMMVAQRNRHLRYLRERAPERYRTTIKRLGLRK
jgi:small subunit ribosomal protein S15